MIRKPSQNYLFFLWTQIGEVRAEQRKGNFAEALKLAADLVSYLPESLKAEFQGRASQINESLRLIQTDNIPYLQKIPDYFLRGIARAKLRETYGTAALNEFIGALTTRLDQLGYMADATERERFEE